MLIIDTNAPRQLLLFQEVKRPMPVKSIDSMYPVTVVYEGRPTSLAVNRNYCVSGEYLYDWVCRKAKQWFKTILSK